MEQASAYRPSFGHVSDAQQLSELRTQLQAHERASFFISISDDCFDGFCKVVFSSKNELKDLSLSLDVQSEKQLQGLVKRLKKNLPLTHLDLDLCLRAGSGREGLAQITMGLLTVLSAWPELASLKLWVSGLASNAGATSPGTSDQPPDGSCLPKEPSFRFAKLKKLKISCPDDSLMPEWLNAYHRENSLSIFKFNGMSVPPPQHTTKAAKRL